MSTRTEAGPRVTDDEMLRCAERLRSARDDFRIRSVRKFTEYLNKEGYAVDWRTIQRWEAGEVRIPADYILMVAKATRTSPTYLLTGEGKEEW